MKSTEKDGNVLPGLGLLQLLPSLFEGCRDPPPLLQILLEGAVGGAMLPHQRQIVLLSLGGFGLKRSAMTLLLTKASPTEWITLNPRERGAE